MKPVIKIEIEDNIYVRVVMQDDIDRQTSMRFNIDSLSNHKLMEVLMNELVDTWYYWSGVRYKPVRKDDGWNIELDQEWLRTRKSSISNYGAIAF